MSGADHKGRCVWGTSAPSHSLPAPCHRGPNAAPPRGGTAKPCTHQVEKVTMSSTTSQCASARDSGAGPRIFLPSALYWLPWQGHMNCGRAQEGGGGAALQERRRGAAPRGHPVSGAMRREDAPALGGVRLESSCAAALSMLLLPPAGACGRRRPAASCHSAGASPSLSPSDRLPPPPCPASTHLVLGVVPGNDAAQVGAHRVQAVLLNGAVLGDNQVGGVALRGGASRCSGKTGGRRVAGTWTPGAACWPPGCQAAPPNAAQRRQPGPCVLPRGRCTLPAGAPR